MRKYGVRRDCGTQTSAYVLQDPTKKLHFEVYSTRNSSKLRGVCSGGRTKPRRVSTKLPPVLVRKVANTRSVWFGREWGKSKVFKHPR